MDFKLIILLTAFVFANGEYKSYKDSKVYKVVPTTESHVRFLMSMQEQEKKWYMFWSEKVTVEGEVRIMVTPERQQTFEEHVRTIGMEPQVAVEDVQKLIDATLQRPSQSRNNNEYAWDYYQTVDEIYAWLDKLGEDYPDVVTVLTIGRTAEDRAVKGVKIDFRREENPTIGVIEGGIHAREWISPATVTWIIKEFVTSTDPEIRFLAENVVWHIFPVLNPDGYSYTFTNNRLWRKNRNPTNFTSCAAWGLDDDVSHGIDLNRNFGFAWNQYGTSNNPCSEVFAGISANSEPETRAIINYVTSLQQEGNVVYYLPFHSYMQMLLIPYGYTAGADVLQVSNYADLYEIGIKAAEKLEQRYGTDYLVGTGTDLLYAASGGSDDWARGVADIPIVLLYELRDIGYYGFLLPTEQIIPNNEEIMDSLIELDKTTRALGYYKASANITKVNLFMMTLILLVKYLI